MVSGQICHSFIHPFIHSLKYSTYYFGELLNAKQRLLRMVLMSQVSLLCGIRDQVKREMCKLKNRILHPVQQYHLQHPQQVVIQSLVKTFQNTVQIFKCRKSAPNMIASSYNALCWSHGMLSSVCNLKGCHPAEVVCRMTAGCWSKYLWLRALFVSKN